MEKYRTKISLYFILYFFMCLIFLYGCGHNLNGAKAIKLVLENNRYVTISQQTFEVMRGGEVSATLTSVHGITITGCDYRGDYDLTASGEDSYTLTLKNVTYSSVVEIETEEKTLSITYDPDCEDEKLSPVTMHYSSFHRGVNMAQKIFERQGYSLIGWSTKSLSGENLASDVNGTAVADEDIIGLGSRFYPDDDGKGRSTLHAVWVPWEDEDNFICEPQGVGIKITGYNQGGRNAKYFAVPDKIDGMPVFSIGKESLSGLTSKYLVLNYSLKTVEADAFAGSSIETMIVYDSIESISDYAVRNCDRLKTLWINALVPPVFSRNYFATFADKYDYLKECADEKKMGQSFLMWGEHTSALPG